MKYETKKRNVHVINSNSCDSRQLETEVADFWDWLMMNDSRLLSIEFRTREEEKRIVEIYE